MNIFLFKNYNVYYFMDNETRKLNFRKEGNLGNFLITRKFIQKGRIVIYGRYYRIFCICVVQQDRKLKKLCNNKKKRVKLCNIHKKIFRIVGSQIKNEPFIANFESAANMNIRNNLFFDNYIKKYQYTFD